MLPDDLYEYVGIFDYVLKSDEWPIIDNHPFQYDEDAWPPPTCVIDQLNGSYSIYNEGELSPSDKAKCEGLEIAAVWGAEHIIDRIMGNDKWHKNSGI